MVWQQVYAPLNSMFLSTLVALIPVFVMLVGRRGFERMLVGSVAENLVRIVSTSLLLVREQ